MTDHGTGLTQNPGGVKNAVGMFFFFLTSGFGTALLLRFLLLLHTKQSIPKEEHDCLMGK